MRCPEPRSTIVHLGEGRKYRVVADNVRPSLFENPLEDGEKAYLILNDGELQLTREDRYSDLSIPVRFNRNSEQPLSFESYFVFQPMVLGGLFARPNHEFEENFV